MRFDLFEQMDLVEAQELLRLFREDGVAHIEKVRAAAAQSGVVADFRIETLAGFLQWAFQQVQTVPKEPDPSVPEWIRSTPDYQNGLFEFDDDSKALVCLVAYYFGECFIREYPHLRWATGNPEFAKANMPVVVGFRGNMELAPMLVLENVFSRIVAQPERIEDIAVAVDTWRSDIR
jgi:hypothetical protein